MIRVVMADDQSLFLESLQMYLSANEDIKVVGTATAGGEAILQVRKHKPDVLLLDLKMPPPGGLEVAATIKSELPETRIIILTTFENEEDILSAIAIGVEGYAVKDIKPEELILAILSVNKGLFVMHPSAYRAARECISKNLDHHLSMRQNSDFERLTVQEERIVQLIAEGKSNKEIAVGLDYTEGTVKNYISRILQKTGCGDRTRLAVFALKRNMT